ncbi:MAG TPA: GAF domain-containing sensor histidine kinase, partial [Desulfatirhabdiaceae bacterium]|nr:GAF domain-containing sensor histidine kinase [Desulfatirhabdiaceae bacterium]
IENGQTTHFMQEGISDAQAVQIDRLLSRVGLREDILLNGKTICIDDISTDTRFTGLPPQHPAITSLLGTPIMHGEEVLGLLYLGDKTDGGKFSHLDQEILETLATHAGVSFNNARLYLQVNHFNSDLEKKIRERTRDLESAMVSAQIANQSKSIFLSSMNHELRTPLNAILGFSEVLAEEFMGTLNEKQKEYVQDILKSGWHLLTLIDNILDLSRVEAGTAKFEPEKLNLADLIEDSLLMVREKALKHGIALKTDIDSRLNLIPVLADRRKMRHVFFNLLSNAAKFTPDYGSITVHARWINPAEYQPSSDLAMSTETISQDVVRIVVEDTGVGVEPEHQNLIFNEFFQITDATCNKTPGTGLGLSISRKYIEMHDGRIWVESDGQNKGSRFIIEIPARTSADSTGMDQITHPHSTGFIQKINNLIQAVKPLDGTFTIFRIGCNRDCSTEETLRIENFLNHAKRDYDVLEIDTGNRFYLILLFSSEGAAQQAWERIVSGLKLILTGIRFHAGMASYPKDGDTPKKLFEKLIQIPEKDNDSD